ncbi:MAG: hypothetical protein A3H52_00765 [Candidatus Zambryskibacteria bacterium RIFCSPLOWO2_02_FULL_39_26]|nr:MAG: hypothetical protein A3H52_00765 [Candidatus Zambryskibacteria bacterium RIFCSPLOWO2_02_FULL_39_26]
MFFEQKSPGHRGTWYSQASRAEALSTHLAFIAPVTGQPDTASDRLGHLSGQPGQDSRAG